MSLERLHLSSRLSSTKIAFIEVKLISSEKDKVLELLSTKLAGFMKVLGKQINEMEKVMNCSQMVTPITENTRTAKLKVKACMSGQMVKYTMANGSEDRKKAMESGKASTETATLVNGTAARLLDMVSTLGLMETSTKVNGSTVCVTAMEQTSSAMVTSTLDSMLTENLMDLANTSGRMETPTLACSKTE